MKLKLLYDYLLDPHAYWKPSHKRNAIKLDRFLDKICNKSGKSKKQLIHKLICLSRVRDDFSSPHLYLVNAGSSGSHWLEKMLAIISGAYNCGEVYLPKPLLSQVDQLDESTARSIIDVIYLVHSGRYEKEQVNSPLINSAHLLDHTILSRYSPSAKTILLVRDPTKIVESRTFRKDEYRNDVAPEQSDEDYLIRNCNYVNNFFGALAKEDFDTIVKYEDLTSNPFETLKNLLNALELPYSNELINTAISETSKQKIEENVVKGKVAPTNLFLGEKVKVDNKYKSIIAQEVGPLRQLLGYDN